MDIRSLPLPQHVGLCLLFLSGGAEMVFMALWSGEILSIQITNFRIKPILSGITTEQS